MALAQQPRDAGERLQMIGAGAFRGEQQKHDINRSAVDGVEIDRLGKPRADAGDALQPSELAVRDGNALAKPGRAEPLALQERVEDVALLQTCEPRRARRQLLEKLLLVLDLERSNHCFGADESS